ncbi:MAG: hypothetical protein ACC645_15840 [Pirellulales bacterium]
MTGMPPHVIRLRGPWQYVPMARTVLRPDGSTREVDGLLPPPGRCTVPSDWADALGPDFRGRVRYQRSFGCPTGLVPGDRVELVIGQVDAWGSATLNQHLLGQIDAGNSGARFDVTSRLAARNDLCVEVELPRSADNAPLLHRPGRENQSGGLLGEVRLEIWQVRR